MTQIEKILIISKQDSFAEKVAASFENFTELKNTLRECCKTLKQGLLTIEVAHFDFIVIDARNQKESPLEISIEMSAAAMHAPFIIVNNPGFENEAIACLRNGVQDYILYDKTWLEKLPYSILQSFETFAHKKAQKNELYRLKKELFELKEELNLRPASIPFHNRDGLVEVINSELKRAQRHGFEVSYFILQLQELLVTRQEKELTESLCGIIRKGDHWGILQPGTFAAILPHTNKLQAKEAANRILQELATQFKIDNSKKNKKSIRVKTFQKTKKATPAELFIKEINSSTVNQVN